MLRSAGFEVVEREDQTYEDMQRGIDQFVRGLRRGDVALFYYSGHGMQINGENFLVPVDLVIDSDEIKARAQSVSANEMLEHLERAETTLKILILDACRNNPFSTGRGFGLRGWASMKGTAVGTYLAFATAPNSTASDNPDRRNGLFTMYLVEALRQSGLELEAVFKQVREGVVGASNRNQVPWSSSSVIGPFYFFGQAVPPRLTGFPKVELPEALRPGTAFAEQYQAIASLNGKSPAEIATMANNGDGYANYVIGLSYQKRRTPMNVQRMIECFQKAADAGVLLGMRKLGNYYELGGGGLQRSAQTAVEWYARAARGGDSIAMYLIGQLYEQGGNDLPGIGNKRSYGIAGRSGWGSATPATVSAKSASSRSGHSRVKPPRRPEGSTALSALAKNVDR